MITKKNKLIGLVLTVALLILMLVVGTGLAVAFSGKLPFSFTGEQLTVEYLLSKQNYGEYKLIGDLPGVTENPINLETVGTAILGPTESFEGLTEADISFVSVNTDKALFPDVVSSFLDTCEAGDYQRGIIGGNEYVQAECNDTFAYIYNGDEAWIIVSTPDGNQALTDIIEQYKLPRS